VFQNPVNHDYLIEKEYREGMISPLAFPNLEISVEQLIGVD
jgi:Uma2 family endonuclease